MLSKEFVLICIGPIICGSIRTNKSPVIELSSTELTLLSVSSAEETQNISTAESPNVGCNSHKHPTNMKTLIALILITCQVFAFGQNEFVSIDTKLVETAVSNSKKETFYPKLIERFNAFDTTLTNEEYRLIYFGYAFQNNYTGQKNPNEIKLSKALDSSNYSEVNKLCDLILKVNPISLKANYNKGLALFKLDKPEGTYIKYRTRYRKLRDAILSSGNGLSCKSSFKVLYVDDEYEIMYRYFEVSDLKSQSLEYPCDHMKISASKYFKTSDMYFDTSESMMAMEKMLKGK